MKKFLYVFNEKDKDSLVEAGYYLIKADKDKNMYIFENNTKLNFDKSKVKGYLSDVLTF